MIKLFVDFLLLGCSSFGGPAAHIAYFRRVFVEQKAWLSQEQFAANLALCQFLPGPASSQLGFLIALQRGGLPAALCAFLGFTLPSLLLMYALAVAESQSVLHSGLVSGMKLLAVVVVADAIWMMASQFCRTTETRVVAIVSAMLLSWSMSPLSQIGLFVSVAILAWIRQRHLDENPSPSLQISRASRNYLLLFVSLLLLSTALAFLNIGGPAPSFYQAGSLVFGGGHVALPLLQGLVGEQLSQEQFLLGYAAAQAVPGPMFSFSAYLGAVLVPQSPLIFAMACSVAIFLPGFLLVLAISPLWGSLSARPRVAAVIMAVNAVAVGMLVSAWFSPVLGSAPHDRVAIFAAILGFVVLRSRRMPLLLLVLGFAIFGVLRY